jgi:Ca2+/H+ antiporter, TMEM165/GDT1 family
MLTATLVSFGVVFLAELGDRSQLMTITYALRHRWWVVLCGIAVASFTVHGLAVTIGHYVGLTLPQRPIAFAAGVAFVGFAAWTWRESRDAGSPVETVQRPHFALLAVISSYLLAELGDKTMLATVALASAHNWLGVWIGATAAMVVADGLAIAVGMLLHKRLPTRLLHALASVLFLLFGLWLLISSTLGQPIATAAVVCAAAAAALVWARRHRARPAARQAVTAPQPLRQAVRAD